MLNNNFMRTQVIQDFNGLPTGVFIPIQDWENIKKQYPNIEQLDFNNDIPQWHKDILDKRLQDYQENPNDVMDFDTFCDELEKEL